MPGVRREALKASSKPGAITEHEKMKGHIMDTELYILVNTTDDFHDTKYYVQKLLPVARLFAFVLLVCCAGHHFSDDGSVAPAFAQTRA
jgi:hypothetical protein